jgi:hypothetical protein
MFMEIKNNYPDQIYSFMALRKAVGWIGILLPFNLMLGVYLIFKGAIPLYSLSQYYYSGMRDVLVGALSAIALFLFFYKGYNKWDIWTSNIAGFFALGIALFPTTQTGQQDLVGKLHFISAAIFFITLACISLFLFTKKDSNPTRQKLQRNIIYIVCGIIILCSLISLAIYYKFFQSDNSHFVFWAETIALVAFGLSWLIKGGTLYRDENSK